MTKNLKEIREKFMEILEFGRIVLFVREEKETFGHADGRKEKKYVILSGD